jgi:hypothetical protein
MPTPAHFLVRLLIYWISGILLSNYYAPSISILLIAFCSWLLSTHYNSVYLEELSLLALPLSIIASPIVPIVMIIGGVGLFFPIGSRTNPLLTGLLDLLTDLAPRQVQICLDLSEVISLYLLLGLLVYVAHQSLHKWRKKEY